MPTGFSRWRRGACCQASTPFLIGDRPAGVRRPPPRPVLPPTGHDLDREAAQQSGGPGRPAGSLRPTCRPSRRPGIDGAVTAEAEPPQARHNSRRQRHTKARQRRRRCAALAHEPTAADGRRYLTRSARRSLSAGDITSTANKHGGRVADDGGELSAAAVVSAGAPRRRRHHSAVDSGVSSAAAAGAAQTSSRVSPLGVVPGR